MVLSTVPYSKERKYVSRKRSYYGGVSHNRPPRPIVTPATGIRGFLKRASKKVTKTIKRGARAFIDGTHILLGVMTALDYLMGGIVPTDPQTIALLASSAMVALRDVNDVGNWIYGNSDDPDDQAEDYSRQILELQQTLAGRVHRANFGRDPTPDQVYNIFRGILIERGEPVDIAEIGANMARTVFVQTHQLSAAVSAGVQSAADERQRRGLRPIWEIPAPPAAAAAAAARALPPPSPPAGGDDDDDDDDVIGVIHMAPPPPRPHARGFDISGGAFEIAKLNHMFDWMLPILGGAMRQIKRPLTKHDWAVFGAQRGWTPAQFIAAYHKFLVDLSDYPDQYPPLMLPIPKDYDEPYDVDAPYDKSLYQSYVQAAENFDNGFSSDELWRNYSGGSFDDAIRGSYDDMFDAIMQSQYAQFNRHLLDRDMPPRRPGNIKEFFIMAAQRAWNLTEFAKGFMWYFFDKARHFNEEFPQPNWNKPFGYNTPFNPLDMYDASLVNRFASAARGQISSYKTIRRQRCHTDKFFLLTPEQFYEERLLNKIISDIHPVPHEPIEELPPPLPTPNRSVEFRPYPLGPVENKPPVQIPHPTLYPRGMTNPDGTLMSLKEAREKFMREHPDVKWGKGYGDINWYEISGSGYYGGTSTAHKPKASPTPTYFKYMFMNQDELRQMPKAELIEWAMRDPDFKFWALSSKLLTSYDFVHLGGSGYSTLRPTPPPEPSQLWYWDADTKTKKYIYTKYPYIVGSPVIVKSLYGMPFTPDEYIQACLREPQVQRLSKDGNTVTVEDGRGRPFEIPVVLYNYLMDENAPLLEYVWTDYGEPLTVRIPIPLVGSDADTTTAPPSGLQGFVSRADKNRFYYGKGLTLRGAGILGKIFGKAKELVGKVYNGAKSLLS